MGTHVVVDGLAVLVVLGFAEVAAGQVYTEMEVVGGGIAGPEGGYLDLQPSIWQLVPGQYPVQYVETKEHHFENSRHFKLSGKPACKKQADTCTAHEEEAVPQLGESLKVGSGFEHQLPHLYSHVGAGEVTMLSYVRKIPGNMYRFLR